jgi:hypothetical protein
LQRKLQKGDYPPKPSITPVVLRILSMLLCIIKFYDMTSHLTTHEVFKKYPDLKTRFNWTDRKLSFFLRSKLLIGYYNRNKRTTMIKEKSLVELIEFTKMTIKEQYAI